MVVGPPWLVAQRPAPADTGIEGRWAGRAGTPLDRVAIAFEFKRDSTGRLKAFLYEPVGNYYGLELPGEVERDSTGYVVASWRLSLAREAEGLRGTLFGLKVPVELRRARSLPAEVPVPALPRGPGPRWIAKLGAPIFGPAATAGGLAFAGTAGGMFYAVRLEDGGFAWAFAAGRPIFGGPAIAGGAVLFGCDDGRLYSLDQRTGKPRWDYDLGDGLVPRVLPHQVIENSGDFDFDSGSPTPVVAGGVVYVGSGDGGLHAVDLGSGRRLWRADAGGKIRSTAIVTADQVIVGTWAGLVRAFDRKTGEPRWQSGNIGPIVTAPVLIGDRVVVGSRYGVLLSLDVATGARGWLQQLWGSSAESEATRGRREPVLLRVLRSPADRADGRRRRPGDLADRRVRLGLAPAYRVRAAALREHGRRRALSDAALGGGLRARSRDRPDPLALARGGARGGVDVRVPREPGGCR